MPVTVNEVMETGAPSAILNEDEKQALISELFQAGVHVGHSKSKSHPKMDEFVFVTRHNIKLMDLNKTVEQASAAAEFLASILKDGGKILVVCAKPHLRDLVLEFAEKLSQPSVTERWLGGTLTNFKTLQKRLEYFEDLLKKRETGELEKYTKKERFEFDKEIADLDKKFKGWRTLKSLPQAILLVDARKHDTVLREARRTKIRVVGIIDTDSDPTPLAYAIPANDDSRASVKAVLGVLGNLIEKFRSAVKENETQNN